MKITSDSLKNYIRPAVLVVLAIMIGPVALSVGVLEAVLPGSGVNFANGFKAYLFALPNEFWLFAGASYGFYSYNRSQDKKTEARLQEFRESAGAPDETDGAPTQ